MKKILALITIMLLIAVSASAQRTVSAASGSTTTFLPQENYVKVNTTAADTVGGTNVKYWIFNLSKSKPQFYSYVMKLDTIRVHSRGAGNRLQVKHYGSLDGSTWVQIGSTFFYNRNAGTLGDSTFAVTDISTGVLWKYLKLEFTGVVANKCSKPQSFTLKIVDKY